MSDKILERVRLLLARAEHPNTPGPEADLCFQQADKLMLKHAIDDAMLAATQTESQRKRPETRTIKLGQNSIGEYWPMLRTVLGEVAAANRCRAVIGYSEDVDIQLVGFAEDCAWSEMLFTSIYFSFVRQINPKWDRAIGYDANVYNFKVAGYKWADINRIAVENGEEDLRIFKDESHWVYNRDTCEYDTVMQSVATGRIGGKIITAYKRHAKLVGDSNLVATTSFSEYRRQFSEAFCSTVAMRLRRQAAEARKDVDSTPGAAVALLDYSQQVDDEFYNLFPQFRPMSEEEAAAREAARQAQREREARERQEMLDKMTPEARFAFLEKEERARRRQAARNQKYWEDQDRKHQSSAHARGRAAGERVDIRKVNPVRDAGTRKEIH